MTFGEIRAQLLDEAKSSPNLLSDLAGLENYIAESYDNRSFVELLQNAEDANSTKFIIKNFEDQLLIGNNGKDFDDNDLMSLCRSAASHKVRGQSIGYRGIGFKSVVGFSKKIIIVSGEFKFQFSKARTSQEIPLADKVPLIRIPHPLLESDYNKYSDVINELKSSGYTTIFIFDKSDSESIELEFQSFDPRTLLFLSNIKYCSLNTKNVNTNIYCNEIDKVAYSLKELEINDITNQWICWTENKVSVAINEAGNQTNSNVFAFLPTENNTGFRGIVNADFNTDPSRRHIIFNEDTIQLIDVLSKNILSLLEFCITSEEDLSVLLFEKLKPIDGISSVQFQKTSFGKLLFECIKKNSNNRFSSFKLCPSWLNLKDFLLISQFDEFKTVSPEIQKIDGAIEFLKFLGAKEASFENILNCLKRPLKLSTLGICQIIKLLHKTVLFGDVPPEIIDKKLVITDSGTFSFREIQNSNKKLSETFITSLNEVGLTNFDIKSLFGKVISREYVEQHLDNIEITKTEFQSEDEAITERVPNESPIEGKIKPFFPEKSESDDTSMWFNESDKNYSKSNEVTNKWRSTELITLEVLNKNGFSLKDVSKQNIGYDLEGLDPNGNQIQIEVKSINYIGQKIRLTNNEVALCREHPNSYFLAIVRQLENQIEIAIVSNPTHNLELHRQCVTWVWECNNYSYNPRIFNL